MKRVYLYSASVYTCACLLIAAAAAIDGMIRDDWRLLVDRVNHTQREHTNS